MLAVEIGLPNVDSTSASSSRGVLFHVQPKFGFLSTLRKPVYLDTERRIVFCSVTLSIRVGLTAMNVDSRNPAVPHVFREQRYLSIRTQDQDIYTHAVYL
jgi:hypothetical protein